MDHVLGRTHLKVSKIGLGTVEIGLPYGIGVTTLPSDAEADTILKTAVEAGITYIDTARGYGVAEERIGRSGITKNPNVVVGTKCGQFLKQERDLTGGALEQRIREEIDTSRKNLRQDRLQLVQLHIELADYVVFDELIEIMHALKDEGKIQHVGIASRGEDAPLAALKTNFFDTLQTAYSILDQRMAARVLPLAQKNHIGIINRSVLLKGVLTPTYKELPDALTLLKNNAQQAERIAQEIGCDLPTLAMRFVLSHPAVSIALIGTIHPTELTTALAAAQAGPLPLEILLQLEKLAIHEPSQIDPSLWPTI